MRFPLSFVPNETWRNGKRSYGASRGKRLHAGCDLYAPIGTPVHAVADDTVKEFGLFYLGTYALVVDHGSFVVRYGGIRDDIAKNLGVGAKVKEGQMIGRVSKLQGL